MTNLTSTFRRWKDLIELEHVLYCRGFPIRLWVFLLPEFMPGYGPYGIWQEAA